MPRQITKACISFFFFLFLNLACSILDQNTAWKNASLWLFTDNLIDVSNNSHNKAQTLSTVSLLALYLPHIVVLQVKESAHTLIAIYCQNCSEEPSWQTRFLLRTKQKGSCKKESRRDRKNLCEVACNGCKVCPASCLRSSIRVSLRLLHPSERLLLILKICCKTF